MKQHAMGWVTALALLVTTVPAVADVPNDDCGTKKAGDACETYNGDKGVCALEASALYCDTSGSASGGGGGKGDGNTKSTTKEDSGCSVSPAPSNGAGEAAALGVFILGCLALRKRFR